MFKSKAAVAALIPSEPRRLLDPRRRRSPRPASSATRSACPAVAIPAATGDITLFNPAAAVMRPRSTWSPTSPTCARPATRAAPTSSPTSPSTSTRSAATAAARARSSCPISRSRCRAAPRSSRRASAGSACASPTASCAPAPRPSATGQVSRAAVTLPEDVRQQITRRRKPGDPSAAIDPMADPAVREAVRKASFEVLVGFQLTQEQLAYNAELADWPSLREPPDAAICGPPRPCWIASLRSQ